MFGLFYPSFFAISVVHGFVLLRPLHLVTYSFLAQHLCLESSSMDDPRRRAKDRERLRDEGGEYEMAWRWHVVTHMLHCY
jgi:hypothetical protein